MGVVAVSDEIYEHILYDGSRHISIASLPGMREQTITINSISKTYRPYRMESRLGHCTGPSDGIHS